jgi:ketose-bisphosphate aldolase
MPVFGMRRMLRSAVEHKFAVGYFESFNLESTQGVIDAAEKLNSPVIIGFSGVFLNSPRREMKENIDQYGALAVSMAESAAVPVSILLNEADDIAMLEKGLRAGFNAVMYQKPGENDEEKLEKTRYLVRTAHSLEADVESELGELPEADVSRGTVSAGIRTDPSKAARFVEQTGVDALAVAVGNVHLLEVGKSRIDLDLVKRLRRTVPVPLVLHGGTGMDERDLREAIGLGIAKVNVGTILKRTYLHVVKSFCCEKTIENLNPHELIGLRGPTDMMCCARKAIGEVVARFMYIFGSDNKAGLVETGDGS